MATTAVLIMAAVGCIQADGESGDEVLYPNSGGPPTQFDAGELDAEPVSPDASAGPDDWQAPDTGIEPDAGDSPPVDHELTIGSEDRPAAVILPEDYDPDRSYPAVFLLHSYTMNASAQDAYFGLSDRVDDRDFILVLPEGTTDASGQQFWNATDYCCDFYDANPDDVGYFESLLDELLEETAADPDQVHLAGHSNGSFFAYRLACEFGDRIDSIAGLAGSGLSSASSCDDPSGDVSVLHIHGTHDAVIYYNGVLGAYPSALVVTRRWAKRNDCSTSRSIDDYITLDTLVMGTETERRSHNSCPDGTDVELWTIYGGSHVPALVDDFPDLLLDFALD